MSNAQNVWGRRLAVWALLLAPGSRAMAAHGGAKTGVPLTYSGVPSGTALVSTAQKFLGMPYVWGGQGKNGFDCSGLIEAVYLRHGYVLPRVSRQQALIGLLASQPLQPGDLLFFGEVPGSRHITHVALSMGGTRFIHAALGKGHVTYDHLGERYYADRLVGARRPLALPPGRYATVRGLAMANVAFDNPQQLASFVATGGGDPNRAAAGSQAGAAPSADMVVEHAGELPTPLARADSVVERATGFADPFGEVHFLPEETGFGLRLGALVAPAQRAALGALDARYFGHGSGLRADLAFPLALQLKKQGQQEQVTGNGGQGGSVRQWGRLVRHLQLGQADAKLFVQLSRVDAITLGEGALVRHFLPNAASIGTGDALLSANAATLQFHLGLGPLQLSGAVDDVFAPNVTGISLKVAPKGPQGRWQLGADWVADWRAPFAGDVTGQQLANLPGRRAVHGAAIGPSLKLFDGHGVLLQAYAQLGALLPHVRPLQVGLGGHLGVLATFAGQQRGALGPVMTVRLEGRLHSARYRPSYFSFAYAARRQAVVNPSLAYASSGEPALDLLLAQRHQPAEGSVLAEVVAALGGRLQLGLSYEDGGPLRRRLAGPDFVARSLTAFASLTGLPIASGTRLLRLHALWHTSERPSLWPPIGRALPGTFAEASMRADVFEWLDVGAAVRKPLGPRVAAPGYALVADGAVHFAF